VENRVNVVAVIDDAMQQVVVSVRRGDRAASAVRPMAISDRVIHEERIAVSILKQRIVGVFGGTKSVGVSGTRTSSVHGIGRRGDQSVGQSSVPTVGPKGDLKAVRRGGRMVEPEAVLQSVGQRDDDPAQVGWMSVDRRDVRRKVGELMSAVIEAWRVRVRSRCVVCLEWTTA
jgi:hypothetical protein